MTKRDLSKEIKSLKQRIDENLILLRRDHAFIQLDEISNLLSLCDERIACFLAVGLCSIIEYFAKSAAAEIFDEYYFTIDLEKLKKCSRFNEIKVTTSNYLGIRVGSFSFGLLVSSTIKINSIFDFVSVINDIENISADSRNIDMASLVNYDYIELDGGNKLPYFQLMKNLFEIRHVIIHELPLGQRTDGSRIVSIDDLKIFIAATRRLLNMTDEQLGKTYFARIGAQPYIEARYIDAEAAESSVEKWNNILLSLIENGNGRSVYVEAQNAWESYARFFSDAWSCRFIGTGAHTSRADKYIELCEARIKEIKKVIDFEMERRPKSEVT